MKPKARRHYTMRTDLIVNPDKVLEISSRIFELEKQIAQQERHYKECVMSDVPFQQLIEIKESIWNLKRSLQPPSIT